VPAGDGERVAGWLEPGPLDQQRPSRLVDPQPKVQPSVGIPLSHRQPAGGQQIEQDETPAGGDLDVDLLPQDGVAEWNQLARQPAEEGAGGDRQADGGGRRLTGRRRIELGRPLAADDQAGVRLDRYLGRQALPREEPGPDRLDRYLGGPVARPVTGGRRVEGRAPLDLGQDRPSTEADGS